MKSNEKKVKVALVDNSISSEIYTPVEHWKPYLDVEWVSFRATKSHFPNLKDGYTHLILTGSEASVLERENWVYEEIEIVQQAVDQELSILGSCYGHQLLALALAGSSHVQRSLQPEIGWISININEGNNFLGERKRAYSFSIHFDEVVNLGEPFIVLASSKSCQVQAIQLKDRPIWGLQIHPEIDVPSGQNLLRNLIHKHRKDKVLFEKALASIPRDSFLIRYIINTFLNVREKS